MRRLLITGGAGFIGANFVRHRLARHDDARVVVLDALTYAGNRASLAAAEADPRFRFVAGDVRDAATVESTFGEHAIDTVVHLAAETHVDRSIRDAGDFVTTNVVGTHVLLAAAARAWRDAPRSGPAAPRFHHVSTDEVYGALAPGDAPAAETAPYAPTSPYAASKAASDHLVRAWHATHGLPATVSIASNNYGPFQFPEKLIPLVVVNALAGRALPVYGDGLQVRDWLHVDDHCAALDRVLAAGRAGETYNLGGDNQWRNLDLVRETCRLIDAAFAADPALARRFPAAPAARGEASATLIRFVADRPGHDRRYALDSAKARAELGVAAARGLAEGLAATLAWYLDNEAWWRAVMDGRYRAWIAAHYGGDAAPGGRGS